LSTKKSTERSRLIKTARNNESYFGMPFGQDTVGQWIVRLVLFGALGPFLAGALPWYLNGWNKDVELRLLFASAALLLIATFALVMWIRYRKKRKNIMQGQ
jgi:hypothetical protein